MQRSEGEKTVKDEEPLWAKRAGCVLFVVLPTILCLPIAYCVLSIVIPGWIEQATFCSTDNAIYRQIEDHANEWIETFESDTDPVIQFTVPGGRTYTAVTSFDREMRDSFYVVLESSRIDAMGAWGFLYLSRQDQPPPKLENGYYRYEHLNRGIYCYWRDRNWSLRSGD